MSKNAGFPEKKSFGNSPGKAFYLNKNLIGKRLNNSGSN